MSIVNVTQAENFKNFVHILASDQKFKETLVDSVNRCVDVPIVNETIESLIFTRMFECMIGTMENVADDMWSHAVTEELRANRQAEKDTPPL